MTAFFLPHQQIVNGSGSPYSGAKAYFYLTGTTTPKAVYTNVGLTIAHTQPVTADSAGRWPAIYLATDAAYNVEIKTSAGVSIFSEDPWRPAVPYNTFTTLLVSHNRVASNPVYYGALGDGVADESSYVQAAINAATGVVDLLGLTYRCDSQLNIPSDIEIKNGTLNFSNSISTNGFLSCLGSIGTAEAMTMTTSSRQITATTSPVAVEGDLIRIHSSNAIGAGTGRAEFHRVESVLGSDIFLQSYTSDLAYSTTPFYAVVSPNTRVRFTDLHIIGSGTTGTYGIYMEYCDNVRIRNCKFTDIYEFCVYMENSVDIHVMDTTCLNSGGAVHVNGCERVIMRGIEDNGYTENNPRIIVGMPGNSDPGDQNGIDVVSSKITISECSFTNGAVVNPCSIGLYLYSRQVTVDRCNLIGGTDGIVLESLRDVSIKNCTIRRNIDFQGAGIRGAICTGVSHFNWSIMGNDVGDSSTASSPIDYGIVLTSNGNSANLDRLLISDNSMFVGTRGIVIDLLLGTSKTIKNVNIRDNVIYCINDDSVGIDSSVALANTLAEHWKINGNHIEITGTNPYGIRMLGTDTSARMQHINIHGNHIKRPSGSGVYGIQVSNVIGASINGNNMQGEWGSGIYFEKSNSPAFAHEPCGVIANNVISGGSGTYASNGIQVKTSSGNIYDVAISGNSIRAYDRAVYLLTTSGDIIDTSVVGNAMRTTNLTTADVVQAVGAAANDINTVAVVGNASSGGRYGANFTNDLYSNHSANAASGSGTAASNGATAVDGTNTPP